jgi:hypothetical protein
MNILADIPNPQPENQFDLINDVGISGDTDA